MSTDRDESRPPGYYIKRRLLSNKPAIVGFSFIVLAILVSLLGYLIMPDQTPDANDGAVQIQKQPPGFKATFIKIRKNRDIEKKSIFHKAFYGQESAYIIVPILDYQIEQQYVRASIFGKPNYYKEYDILDAVMALQSGTTSVAYDEMGEPNYTYNNLDGIQEVISQSRLVELFEKDNIETRTYWLGTDRMGRDMLSRLLFGTRISLSIGFLAVLISMFLGMSLGSLAGFFGGKIDMLVLWFMSVIWSIPGIILVIRSEEHTSELQSRSI